MSQSNAGLRKTDIFQGPFLKYMQLRKKKKKFLMVNLLSKALSTSSSVSARFFLFALFSETSTQPFTYLFIQ